MMLNTSLRNCDVCPMCKRPFGRNPKSRSGNNPGLEKQAEKELKDITKNCKKAYEMLEGELHLALTRSHRERYNEFHNDGWLCSEDMRSEEYVNSLKNMALSSKGRWLSLKGENEK
jgi:hypothetical protein